jgi:hypothetical protein
MSGLELMKTTNLFFCPKCGSKRVGAVFYVPVGKIGKVLTSPTPPKDRCLDCRYEELRGYFELINRREKKIDSILDDIKI